MLTLELDLGDKSAGRDKEGKVQTHQKKKKKNIAGKTNTQNPSKPASIFLRIQKGKEME